MDFDFYEAYQDLPIHELVKVARTPSDHLPEAIAAAENILRERGISEQEIADEVWKLAQEEMDEGLAKRRLSDYTGWIVDLFRRDAVEEAESAQRWFQLLLLVYAVYYIWNIYTTINEMVWFSRCELCTFNRFRCWHLLVACYITLSLFCLFKQLRLGWTLLLIQVIVLGLVKVPVFLRLFYGHADLRLIFEFFLLPVLPLCIFAWFLWRPPVLAFFRVDGQAKSRAALIGFGAGVVAMMAI